MSCRTRPHDWETDKSEPTNTIRVPLCVPVSPSHAIKPIIADQHKC